MQRPDSPAAFEDGPRKDKGYRRYASNVERALSLFDTALQEWADYIAFLGRLLKALQSRPSDTTDIPYKAVVAKRLSRCLAPMLPSGVHQKTLEVYAYVFSVLGKDGLSRDLPLWLPGLSPTLSFASLSVKPALLSLYETFVVPLNPNILRSALKAIVLALLPGLEEETSEEFERTLLLLNTFRSTLSRGLGEVSSRSEVSGDQHFWQSIFLASITSPSRRQGALAYLSRELPRLGNVPTFSAKPNSPQEAGGSTRPKKQLPPEIDAVTSPEPGLLVRCFAAGLQDEQLLIQRGFLDLLVTHLPLSSAVFSQRVAPRDLELLVTSAASVVSRREMSLNRRLWTWFLGPQSSTDKDDSAPASPTSPNSGNIPILGQGQSLSQTDYFQRYGLNSLTSGILKSMQDDSLPPAEKARPFRICLSLMDRWEIGGLVIPRLFVPAMECIWRYQDIAASKDAFAEVLRSANVFFDGIESSLIWSELTRILMASLGPGRSDNKQPDKRARSLPVRERDREESNQLASSETQLDLINFIITRFNVREEEMLALHIPLASLALLINIRLKMVVAPVGTQVDDGNSLIVTAFRIGVQLLDTIPQRTFAVDSPPCGVLPTKSRQMLKDIQQFYEKLRNGAGDVAPPLPNHIIREAIIHNAAEIITGLLSSPLICAEYLEKAADLLGKALRKAPGLDDYEYRRLMSTLVEATETLDLGKASSSFATVAAFISILETIEHACALSAWKSDHHVRLVLPRLLRELWKYTSPSRPTHNVEAVRGLWRLHRISPDTHLVEGTVASLIFQKEEKHGSQSVEIEGARRFATLWAHTHTNAQSTTDRHSGITRRESEKIIGKRDDAVILERPLLLLLDSLFDENCEIFTFVITWLQSLSTMQNIIEIVIHRLHAPVTAARLSSAAARTDEQGLLEKTLSSNDVDEALYYLQTISNLLHYSTANVCAALDNPMKGFPKADPNLHDSVRGPNEETEAIVTYQLYLMHMSIGILQSRQEHEARNRKSVAALRRTAVLLLQRLFLGPSSNALGEIGLAIPLIQTLLRAVEQGDLMLQVPLTDLILVVLKAQAPKGEAILTSHRRQTSRDTFRSVSQISLSMDRSAKDISPAGDLPPPPALLDCLMLGISSPMSHSILEHWVHFMNSCLPFYTASAFQTLMPLVDCFIKTVESVFHRLQALFEGATSTKAGQTEPIAIINTLLNGLEQVLAKGHDQMLQDEGHAVSTRSPEQIQGFFGNMVSGVFTPESQKIRSATATANNRLTVLLCFKDAVRVSFRMWSWGDVGSGPSSRDVATSASFNYASLRLRNRTRRILEHLFAAEALECLETLVEFGPRAGLSGSNSQLTTVFNLLHALEGSRPRNTIPALFNAIYSRTNPNVLDPVRKSTLTSNISDVGLASFLAAYTRSIEDDALDEIWTDCMTFLRDVLGNPLPHRQTLPRLLEFTAILGEKIDNTNFGEQRKMRRDIGELFVRLLAATFTIKPLTFPQESAAETNGETDAETHMKQSDLQDTLDSDDVVAIVAVILPNISKILVDADRIMAATVTISTHILVPTLRWKTFPRNVTLSTLNILKTMSRIPAASKTWKKDVAEAFYDSKFFHTGSLHLVRDGWVPVIRQWAISDKDRMPDLLSRLTAPSSAGIMFGVGASSARLEADRKAQLNLRRVVLLILSADRDAFIVNLNGLQDKLMDLMTATAASSPSSITRAEVYKVFRALVLRTTPVHLASLWPIISTELYEALSSMDSAEHNEIHNVSCLLQAAKLLDNLLIVAPDDFQLREWLFVTDTIDAVYRPPGWRPIALADGLAESLDSRAGAPHSASTPFASAQQGRRPLLKWDAIHNIPQEQIVDRVLRPFLRQLSINTFESTYRMEAADHQACLDDLLHDLFDDGTLV